jgi:Cys-tRNA(Pro)/Cys-tRNA(Cys) deacylase
LSKKKQAKTNAIRLIEQKKIPYIEHEYAWDENHLSASHAAEVLGENIERVFKTLVTVGNNTGPLVAVIPGNEALDLKKLAKVSGNKRVEMLHLKDLEQTTGYIRGGCSPIGMKKLFPTFVDQHAEKFETITISAGRRGMQVELDPEAILQLTNGKFADLTAE